MDDLQGSFHSVEHGLHVGESVQALAAIDPRYAIPRK
jgi:hypothetical protein